MNQGQIISTMSDGLFDQVVKDRSSLNQAFSDMCKLYPHRNIATVGFAVYMKIIEEGLSHPYE